MILWLSFATYVIRFKKFHVKHWEVFIVLNFPYSNFHQLNLDWLLQQMKSVTDWIDNTASEDIQNIITQKFNDLMLDATYIAESETLVLALKEKEET